MTQLRVLFSFFDFFCFVFCNGIQFVLLHADIFSPEMQSCTVSDSMGVGTCQWLIIQRERESAPIPNARWNLVVFVVVVCQKQKANILLY